MRVLGTTIEVARRERLSRFQYYLQLTDALSKCSDPYGHLKELADSFGHDLLNLATLAGRLLRYEGVVPTTTAGSRGCSGICRLGSIYAHVPCTSLATPLLNA
jgi:hypothetical protein